MKKAFCRFSLLLLVSISLSLQGWAQIPTTKDFTPTILDPYYTRACKSHFVKIPLREVSVVPGAQTQVRNLNPSLKSSISTFNVLHDITSPGGRHLTLEQVYNTTPVFHSQIKVNLDKQNNIKSIFDNSWDVSRWNKSALENSLNALNLDAAEKHFLGLHATTKTDIRSRKVIAVLNDEPQALIEIELWDNVTNEHLLLLTNNAFEVFLRRDLNSYHSSVTATALVFNPDPLTTAHVSYGAPYIDDSNRDVTVLNNQRLQKDLEVTFSGGAYRLQNSYVQIMEFSAPSVAPDTSATPAFNRTRTQTGFEDVNTFYHLTQYRAYVDTLGFSNLVSDIVYADAHALNGGDQSMFTDHVLGPRLFFGEGGVDDAEDADVIVHENGHSLAFAASPNSNSGLQRQAVDEGLSDYLAVSYSKSLDTFRYKDMFTWDGHNEYWNGRTAAYSGVYPDDLTSNIHRDGQIYSTAITNIMDELGRHTADRLLLQSLYGFAAGMNMRECAMLLYDADTALYGGANYCVIYAALLEKGLTEVFPVPAACNRFDPTVDARAGKDTSVCRGDSIAIGDPSSMKSGYSYSWTPAAGTGSPLSLITNVAPVETTNYVLTATSFSGAYNYDTVTVSVISCSIHILNSEGFKYGEDLRIIFPLGSEQNSVELFDAFGRLLYKSPNINDPYFLLSGTGLPAAGYIVRVKSVGHKKEQKVVKIR